jgi:hypothetical protein
MNNGQWTMDNGQWNADKKNTEGHREKKPPNPQRGNKAVLPLGGWGAFLRLRVSAFKKIRVIPKNNMATIY